MKPFRKILILSTIVFSIILFWLAPSVNKARDIRYTRIYENTEKKPKVLRDSTNKKHQKKSTTLLAKKIYKKESIQANSKLRDIKPYMFSRSMQFTQEVKVIELDTLNDVKLSTADTIVQIQ